MRSETEKDLRNLPGSEAVGILQTSVDTSMGKGMVEVRPDDGITTTLPRKRLRRGARAACSSDATSTSSRRTRLGCTSGPPDGLTQPSAPSGQGCPPHDGSQEGLAVLSEMLNLAATPGDSRADASHRRDPDGQRRVEFGRGVRDVPHRRSHRGRGLGGHGPSPSEPPGWRRRFTKDLGYGEGLVLALLMCVSR